MIKKTINMNINLHWAAQNGHLAVIEKLIAHGAQLDIEDKYGKTPLNLVADNDKLEMVDYLLSKISHYPTSIAPKIFLKATRLLFIHAQSVLHKRSLPTQTNTVPEPDSAPKK